MEGAALNLGRAGCVAAEVVEDMSDSEISSGPLTPPVSDLVSAPQTLPSEPSRVPSMLRQPQVGRCAEPSGEHALRRRVRDDGRNGAGTLGRGGVSTESLGDSKHGKSFSLADRDIATTETLTSLRKACELVPEALGCAAAPPSELKEPSSIAALSPRCPNKVSEMGRKDDVPLVQAFLEQKEQDTAPEVAPERPPAKESGSPNSIPNQNALDELARTHNRLIGTILSEEEELITAHRQHIDGMVELIKEEMVQLNNVDRPGSDVDAYVTGLERVLRVKTQYIDDIRQRLSVFKEHLEHESTLSRQFQMLVVNAEG